MNVYEAPSASTATHNTATTSSSTRHQQDVDTSYSTIDSKIHVLRKRISTPATTTGHAYNYI